MTEHPRIPQDPLGFIQERIHARAIFWTYHVNMRMRDRFIQREQILHAVDTYEVVESYPHDKYLPSYLLLAREGTDAFHVLFAVDVEGNNVRIVTAYRPSTAEWQSDLKTRRQQK